MFRGLSLTALALGMAAAPAHAEEADAQPADDRTIIVTGRDDGYQPVETVTATKTNTPLLDIPQSITVVTREQIEDRGLRSIADVLRYVPGVTFGQGEGHRDQVTLRGNNTTADFFVDGVRDDVQYFRSFYNVERVEVLKGPNAMIFGRGGGGGVINRVTKSPLDRMAVGGAASIDTFGAFDVSADVNAVIGDGAAARLNAFYERLDNHRQVFEGDRFGINPTVAFTTGPARFDLSYEYADDERVVDRGIPSFAGRPAPGLRDRFFGTEGVNESDFRAHVARLRAQVDLAEGLSLNARLQYGDYDKQYRNAFAATPITVTGGVQTVGVEAYFDPTERDSLFGQADLVWETATGSVDHVVLAGVEYGDQNTLNQRINGFFDSGVPTTNNRLRTVIPVMNPIAIPPITFRAGSGNRSVATDAEVFAAYLQDQVSFGPMVDLILGVRFDRFRLGVENLLNGARFERTDEEFSPRVGLVFKPVEPVSLYASYSRSFLPQSGDQFLSLDLSLAALEPERFENLELGVKWNILPALTFTAALYRLDRDNTRAAGPTPGTIVLTGEQRSKGFEAGLQGRIAPNWSISAGYTLQEAEIRTTTTAAPAGREVPQVPRHQASLFTRYDLDDRFGLGFGAYHQSKSFAAISNAVVLPSYTRLDAALFVKLTDRIEAQVNVENLLDETYFPTAHNDNNISTGAPLNARFTLRAKF